MIPGSNTNKPNPNLFKGEKPTELLPETYYAYLDTVEQIDNEFYIQFDCVVKKVVDETQISSEALMDLPSIIISTKGSVSEIKSLFNYGSLYQLESQWMVIKTQFNKSDSKLSQNLYFNFQEVRSENSLSYNLESIRLFRDLSTEEQAKVRELERATILEESPAEEITEFFNEAERRLSNLSHVNVYNVGQGNCVGLVTSENQPLLYFDVGGGYKRNAHTYPAVFKLCNTRNPPVILSHWDQDHYQTAVLDTEEEIFNSKWLVPFQKIGITAKHIAYALQQRNNLLCWNSELLPRYDFNNFSIVKCFGDPKYKNSSGLALFVNQRDGNHILLPGDAKFAKIPDCSNERFTGLVVSHHGSSGEINGMPNSNLPAMTVYSFGINNHENHPTEKAKKAYSNKGWVNKTETVNGSIAMTSNLADLNPPCGSINCTLNVIQHY